MEEINLDNPIFAFYICINGLSRKSAAEVITQAKDSFCIYSNITQWIIATDEPSRIECVYDGQTKIRNKELNKLIDQLNKRIEIFANTNSLEEFKTEIRQWRLENLLNTDETN
jgi:hypothetical protein